MSLRTLFLQSFCAVSLVCMQCLLSKNPENCSSSKLRNLTSQHLKNKWIAPKSPSQAAFSYLGGFLLKASRSFPLHSMGHNLITALPLGQLVAIAGLHQSLSPEGGHSVTNKPLCSVTQGRGGRAAGDRRVFLPLPFIDKEPEVH